MTCGIEYKVINPESLLNLPLPFAVTRTLLDSCLKLPVQYQVSDPSSSMYTKQAELGGCGHSCSWGSSWAMMLGRPVVIQSGSVIEHELNSKPASSLSHLSGPLQFQQGANCSTDTAVPTEQCLQHTFAWYAQRWKPNSFYQRGDENDNRRRRSTVHHVAGWLLTRRLRPCTTPTSQHPRPSRSGEAPAQPASLA